MKKINLLITGLILSLVAFVGLGCADVNGLHNQEAADVTFVFKNMGENISGDYTIPGNFNNWDNTTTQVTLKNGEGTSEPITVSRANIQFTLIKTNDSSWLRSWYPDVKGNSADTGSAGSPYQNFYYDGLDLSAGEITIVIDGESGSATPEVE